MSARGTVGYAQTEPPYSDVGPLAVMAPDKAGRTALHSACSVDVAVALLSRGANPRASCFGRLLSRPGGYEPAGLWLDAEEYLTCRRRKDLGEKTFLQAYGNSMVQTNHQLPWELSTSGQTKWERRQARRLDG